MNTHHLNPSLALSLIALVMASAGTGYAALGDGDGGGAVAAGNARGEPVEIQLRNRSRGETGLVTASDGYSLRLSNTQERGGGGAVYGCRAPDAPPGDNLACLYADNLRGGKAFLFRSQEGPTVGHFDLGNPAGPPFTTNATGLVANLNADKVDGLEASQLQGGQGPAGPQGPQGPAGGTGAPGPAGTAVAWARIEGFDPIFVIDSSPNFSLANVRRAGEGTYCFDLDGISPEPKALLAMSGGAGTAAASDQIVTGSVSAGTPSGCTGGEEGVVKSYDVSLGGANDTSFTVFFED